MAEEVLMERRVAGDGESRTSVSPMSYDDRHSISATVSAAPSSVSCSTTPTNFLNVPSMLAHSSSSAAVTTVTASSIVFDSSRAKAQLRHRKEANSHREANAALVQHQGRQRRCWSKNSRPDANEVQRGLLRDTSVQSLRKERDELAQELARLRIQDKDLKAAIFRMRQQHGRRLKHLVDDAKHVNARENRELHQLKRVLEEKQKELLQKEKQIYKLECEKLYLGEEIFRLTGIEEGFWNDESPPKPIITERERGLIRRSSALGTQVGLLERKCGNLRAENETLRRMMELERERERPNLAKERQKEVQVLRKKNLELTTMTRKLEEKVKSLEKKTKESSASTQSICTERGPKSNVASRQREREAEAQRQLIVRDREILALKERLRDVSRRLASKDKPLLTRSAREKGARELESIVVQAAKERMQLERHLAIATENLQRAGDVDIQKYLALEETNRHLRLQLEELDRISQQHKIIQLQLEEKNDECLQLAQKLKAKTELCDDLENQLARVIEKNTELTIQNSDLQRQIQELQRLSEECDSLRQSLTTAESECGAAQEEVGELKQKVSNLETLLQQTREAAERRRQLETEHKETLAQLQETREEVARLSVASDAERQSNFSSVEQLKARIRELEKKSVVQNERHEELLREMGAAKRAAELQQQKQREASSRLLLEQTAPVACRPTDLVSSSNGVNPSQKPNSVDDKASPSSDAGVVLVATNDLIDSRLQTTFPLSQVSPDSGTASPATGTLEHQRVVDHYSSQQNRADSARSDHKARRQDLACNGMDSNALAATGLIGIPVMVSGPLHAPQQQQQIGSVQTMSPAAPGAACLTLVDNYGQYPSHLISADQLSASMDMSAAQQLMSTQQGLLLPQQQQQQLLSGGANPFFTATGQSVPGQPQYVQQAANQQLLMQPSYLQQQQQQGSGLVKLDNKPPPPRRSYSADLDSDLSELDAHLERLNRLTSTLTAGLEGLQHQQEVQLRQQQVRIDRVNEELLFTGPSSTDSTGASFRSSSALGGTRPGSSTGAAAAPTNRRPPLAKSASLSSEPAGFSTGSSSFFGAFDTPPSSSGYLSRDFPFSLPTSAGTGRAPNSSALDDLSLLRLTSDGGLAGLTTNNINSSIGGSSLLGSMDRDSLSGRRREIGSLTNLPMAWHLSKEQHQQRAMASRLEPDPVLPTSTATSSSSSTSASFCSNNPYSPSLRASNKTPTTTVASSSSSHYASALPSVSCSSTGLSNCAPTANSPCFRTSPAASSASADQQLRHYLYHLQQRQPLTACNADCSFLRHHQHQHPEMNSLDSTEEINRIMAKIEQDNKILAELDKARSTIGGGGGAVKGRQGGTKTVTFIDEVSDVPLTTSSKLSLTSSTYRGREVAGFGRLGESDRDDEYDDDDDSSVVDHHLRREESMGAFLRKKTGGRARRSSQAARQLPTLHGEPYFPPARKPGILAGDKSRTSGSCSSTAGVGFAGLGNSSAGASALFNAVCSSSSLANLMLHGSSSTTTMTTSTTTTLPTPGLSDLTSTLCGMSLHHPSAGTGSVSSLMPATGITLTPSGTVGVNLVPSASSSSSSSAAFLAETMGAQQQQQQVPPPPAGSVGQYILNAAGMRVPLATAGNLLTQAAPHSAAALGQSAMFQAHAQQQQLGTPVIDMLDIPGKGKCYVYIARYSYDPFSHSPNDNPESELPLTAGDYVLVWGNMDEDGFFDGELLDGRRGSVPSNFVEKLEGDDLLDFHQAVVLGLRPDSREEDYSTSIPTEVDFPAAGAGTIIGGGRLPGPPLPPDDPSFYADYQPNRMRIVDYSYMDLEDILEEEEEEYMSRRPGEGPVPAPKQLTLERQLNKSILIGWNAPDCPSNTIESYHVYVDGILKTTVKATERTRALVEDVDSLRPHRISVRSVTPNRRTSRDAACTMLIGKHVPLAPTYVRATNVTSTSAVISWLPSNSNFQHVVCVNNVEVRTVKPGVYRHTITGLTPNTVYRVTVRAKNIKAPHFDEKSSKHLDKLSAHTEFRTLPKGLPDPPVDIQVEAGPQDGTLLVTWLPVTINNAGTSNGAPVTGYAVYADGKKICDVDSPTGDHALIDLKKIPGFLPRQVTVRTKSRDGQSGDSIPGVVPATNNNNRRMNSANKAACPESLGDMTERSELSDIAEEPEEYLSSSSTSPTAEGMDHHGRTVPTIGGQQQQGGGYMGMGRMMNKRHGLGMDEDMRNDMPSHMNIPSIEITKDGDRSMDWNGSDEEYNRSRQYGGVTDLSDAEMNDDRMRGQRNVVPQPQRRTVPQARRGPGGVAAASGPYYGRKGPGDVGQNYGQQQQQQGSGGYQQQQQQDNNVARLFVATYDYDPTTQSPNMDSSAELPFNQGDLIRVYGDKDGDGFFYGEVNGRRGLIPGNMVKEVQIDDAQIAKEMMTDGRSRTGTMNNKMGGGAGDYLHQHQQHPADRSADIYEEMPVRRMIAAYDYDPQQSSPNVDSDAELAFRCGDVILVYGDMDDDGFFLGELHGRRGLVPSNFLVDDQVVDQEFYNVHNPQQQQQQQQPGRGNQMMGQNPPMRPSGPGAHGPPPPPRDREARRRAADQRFPGDQGFGRNLLPGEETSTMMGQTIGMTGWDQSRVGNSTGMAGGGFRVAGVGQQQQPSSMLNPPNQQSGRNSALGFVSSLFGGNKQQQNPTITVSDPAANKGSIMDFVIPQTLRADGHAGAATTPSSHHPSMAGAGPSSFVQRLGEFTHRGGTGGHPQQQQHQQQQQQQGTGEASAVDSLMSKGKELIFKKFGLGS